MKTQLDGLPENTLFDLRKVLTSDAKEVLNTLKMFDWTEENAEARKALLAYVDKLHKRWDDLYSLEYSNF